MDPKEQPWDLEEMAGKKPLLLFSSSPLVSSKKNPLWSFMFLLSGSLPSELLSQGSAGASLTGHTLNHVLVPPQWEGGSCPSSAPLLTSEGTVRHEVPQDQIFLHPSRFLALPAFPFGFAPVDWLCDPSPVALRSCTGALGGFLVGFMPQRKCKHLYQVQLGGNQLHPAPPTPFLDHPEHLTVQSVVPPSSEPPQSSLFLSPLVPPGPQPTTSSSSTSTMS